VVVSDSDNNGKKQQLSRMEYYVAEVQKAALALENKMKLVTEFGQLSYFYSGFVWSEVEYAL